MQINNENNEPITFNLTASYPFPSNNNLWPGRTPSAVSPSGAPRKTAGIILRKVCVIAIAIMNVPSINGDVKPIKYPDTDTTKTEIRLIWMPGIMPVIIPAVIPKNSANSRL